MRIDKSKFLARMKKMAGLDQEQAETVYELMLDDRFIPSHEIVKTIEVVREVPVEVIKKVEVMILTIPTSIGSTPKH